MKEVRSSLSSHIGKSPATPEEMHHLASAAWHQRNVLVVQLDDPATILNQMDRGILEAVGVKLYGRREPKP